MPIPEVLPPEQALPPGIQDNSPVSKARTDYKFAEPKEKKDKDKRLNLTPDEKKSLIAELTLLISQAEQDMATKLRQWIQADKAYKAKLAPRNFPYVGASSICIPLVKTKLRKLTRKLKGALFRNRPIFPLEPEEESDVERVEQIESFLDYNAKREMRIELPAEDVLNDIGRYGTGFMEVVWREEKEYKTDTETYDGSNPADIKKFLELYPDADKTHPEYYIPLLNGATITFDVSYEKPIYRGPKPERVSRKNVVTPKGYTDINKMPFWFKKMKKSWYELEDDVNAGRYEKEGLEFIRGRYAKAKDPLEYIKKQYLVYEGMYLYKYKSVRQKCLIALIPEENAYMRGIIYPYEHGRSYLIPFRIIRDADNFDGEALADDLGDIQKLLNMIFNTAIDSDTIANVPTFKAKGTGINFDIERWYPGKIWHVEDMKEFEQMQTGSNKANSLNLMNLAERVGDDVSGINALMSGTETPLDPRAPAAKSQMLLNVSQEDLAQYLKTFLISWNEVAYQICELYSQYGTEGKEYRVLNEAGLPSLKAVPGDLRIRPDLESHAGESAFSAGGRKASLIQLMALLQQDPIMMEYMRKYPQKWTKLWAEVIQEWGSGIGKITKGTIPSESFIFNQSVQVKMEAMRRITQQNNQIADTLRAQGASEEEIQQAIESGPLQVEKFLEQSMKDSLNSPAKRSDGIASARQLEALTGGKA